MTRCTRCNAEIAEGEQCEDYVSCLLRLCILVEIVRDRMGFGMSLLDHYFPHCAIFVHPPVRAN